MLGCSASRRIKSTLLPALRQRGLRERQPLHLTLTSGFRRQGLWRRLFMDLNGERFSASSSVKIAVFYGSAVARIAHYYFVARVGRLIIESLLVGLEEGSKGRHQRYLNVAAL